MSNIQPIQDSITIDGPASSGKSTIGHRLAKQLGFLYFDTGCMYRAVTAVGIRRMIDIHSENAVTKLARDIKIEVLPPTEDDGRQYTVLVDNEDVTWALRDEEVDANVSIVAAYPEVRRILTDHMRQIGNRGRTVMVGRDIGTVVMPDAEVKVYLDASNEERARRRHQENLDRGVSSDYAAVFTSIEERDRIDKARETAPLRAAADAHTIDTTGISADDVLKNIIALITAVSHY